MTKDATKVAKAQLKTDYLQIRIRPYDKGKVKLNAKKYAGGDMTLWAEHCFENAPRKHLIPEKK